ncbi:MAG: FAD-dependent oxidoreductase [Clostridia bacterium]|nr:FAD-dependent oxidoreductase [Clostridia bacterium]
MQYTKELEIKYNVDVFVAGGGAAGVAAAVAAARSGKRVFLAEATGCLGGMGTTGLVPAFAPFSDGVNTVASGIGFEIRQALKNTVPVNSSEWGSRWSTIDAEELKREYDKLLKSENVDFSFFTSVCDAVCEDGHINAVILTSKSGMFAVKAEIYIDCTGDGDLCALGGGKFEIGDENNCVMPGTLCSLWAYVDDGKVGGGQSEFIEKAYEDGVITYKDRHLPGMYFRRNGMAGGNIGHTFGVNPVDEKSLTEAMVRGRQSMTEYEKYYKTYLEGYENMVLCATASVLGVRESRRIVCDYMLGFKDYLDRAVFDDEIGRYCYPVDIHVMNTDDEEFERFSKEYDIRYGAGESYGIPYRSLVPVSFSNVLVAGRCIGAERQMQASVRVMPGCFITGQAAGAAAALACDTQDVRQVDTSELQDTLKKLGAYLPNAK